MNIVGEWGETDDLQTNEFTTIHVFIIPYYYSRMTFKIKKQNYLLFIVSGYNNKVNIFRNGTADCGSRLNNLRDGTAVCGNKVYNFRDGTAVCGNKENNTRDDTAVCGNRVNNLRDGFAASSSVLFDYF